MKNLCIHHYPICAQQRFRPDCTTAQGDQNLHWVHMLWILFSDIASQLILVFILLQIRGNQTWQTWICCWISGKILVLWVRRKVAEVYEVSSILPSQMKMSGPSCSKLTMSLVNESLKFTSSDTQICWNFLLKKSAKNIRILYIESAKTVNEMTLNKLVKLTMLWTTGPWHKGDVCI